MKGLRYTGRYKKQYRRLPQSVKKKINRQLGLLITDYRHPSLASRKMTNQRGVWEARIDKYYRFTFKLVSDYIILRAVGTHEIYRKP